MLYPEKMAKVTIAAPRQHLPSVISSLYELGLVHIKSHIPKNTDDLPIGPSLEGSDQASKLLLDLQAIRNFVQLPKIAAKKPASASQLSPLISSVKEMVLQQAQIQKQAQDKGRLLEKQLEQLEFLKSAGISDLHAIRPSHALGSIYGFCDDVNVLSALEHDCMVFYSQHKPHQFAIFFEKSKEQAVKSSLQGRFTEYRIDIELAGTVSQNISKVKEEQKAASASDEHAKKKLRSIGDEYGARLKAANDFLVENLRKGEAPLKFAVSEFAFVVSGWVPAKNQKSLEQRLSSISPSIYLKSDKAGPDAPTKINNPGPSKPFEFFLRLYSLPSYKEIDPTFLIFLTFPLFYGFMLGDIGYGSMLFALALFARFKMNKFRALIDITIISAITTIIFGFVFGEFFGAEQVFGYALHPYFHRLAHPTELITISVVIGLVHINLGFLFGIMNGIRQHHYLHAIGKAGWVSLQVGGLLLVLDMVKIFQFDNFIAALILVASVIIILLGEGALSVVEIPTLLGNILSYARLAAIGLASGNIALAVNGGAHDMFASANPIMFVAAVAILLVGHIGNLMLGLLDANLQSLRLHFVEHFTKFYHGSGKPYQPFGKGA